MIASLIPETTLTKNSGGPASVTESNLPSIHASSLGIDANAAAKIIATLTNLYSDENLAVVREYSTNALDSHLAAGVTEPIQVELPSALNSQLVIRDFGLGLSKTEIIEVYAKYGASTKSDRIDQVGAFGLGCKSGLSLASQFTVTAVQNGLKTITIISRGDADGVPTYSIISEDETDERNGVTISIAVPNASQMQSRAKAFFETWQPGTVLVDGVEPHSIWNTENNFYRRDGLLVMPSRSVHSYDHYVVMGNVKYKVDVQQLDIDNDIRNTMRRLSFYMEVPIGSFDLPPSREEIRYSAFSKAFLGKLYANIAAEMRKIAFEEVTAAENLREALKSALRWDAAGFSPDNGFTYDGVSLVRTEEIEETTRLTYNAPKSHNMDTSKYRRNLENVTNFFHDSYLNRNIVWVQIDPKVEDQEKSTINRFRSYVSSTEGWETIFLISAKKPSRQIREGHNLEIIKAEDVMAESIIFARAQRAAKKAAGIKAPRAAIEQTYEVCSVVDGTKTTDTYTRDELKSLDGKVFIIRDNHYNDTGILSTHAFLSKETLRLVSLSSGQRIAPVEKTLPNAAVLDEYGFRSAVMNFTTKNLNLTPEQSTYAALSRGRFLGYSAQSTISALTRMSADNSFGKEIDDLLGKMKAGARIMQNLDYSTESIISQQAETDSNEVEKIKALAASIPLLGSMRYNDEHNEHVLEYVKHFISLEV